MAQKHLRAPPGEMDHHDFLNQLQNYDLQNLFFTNLYTADHFLEKKAKAIPNASSQSQGA